MTAVYELKIKYPGATVWQMGDSPALASELADLIRKGIKTATCGSLASYQQEGASSTIGGYIIILEHQRFFTQEGSFSEDMALIAEEFEVVERL